MADFPFIYPVNLSILTNTTQTAIFSVSAGETYTVDEILTNINTAGVNVTNIRDQAGRGYMPVGGSNVIPIAMVGDSSSTNENNVLRFKLSLVIPSNGYLAIDVQNTTAGTVTPTLALVGHKSQGS